MSQERTFGWESHWKQLGWACKLGGEGFQGVSKVGQTVIANLMESQIQHPLAGSVWGEFGKGSMPLPAFLSGIMLPLQLSP